MSDANTESGPRPGETRTGERAHEQRYRAVRDHGGEWTVMCLFCGAAVLDEEAHDWFHMSLAIVDAKVADLLAGGS